MNLLKISAAGLALVCLLISACSKPMTSDVPEGSHVHADGSVHANHDEHVYDSKREHGHNDDLHPIGNNGGHLFAFDSDYQGEWSNYSSNDVVRVYILDAAGKELVPVKGTVVITSKDQSTFELDPEEPDADGKAAKFTLDNSALSIAMNLGVTIELKIDDKAYSAKIKPHSH